MKFVRITLMGIGGAALAVLLLAPKTAHAVVATLVQVVNTTANPVPNLDTDRKDRMDSGEIVRRLRTQGIVAAPRQGWVRTSPHFYISAEDIDRLLAVLP